MPARRRSLSRPLGDVGVTAMFTAVNGATIDTRCWQAIRGAEARVSRATYTAPGVLWGLELKSPPCPDPSPPGTRRPENTKSVWLSPGAAIVPCMDGTLGFVEIAEPTRLLWPIGGPTVSGSLVLCEVQSPRVSRTASRNFEVEIGFITPQDMDPQFVELARAVGNGRDWITDIVRVWGPEHTAVRGLLRLFDELDLAVWETEQRGSAFDRYTEGRDWARLQTAACTAVQAARMPFVTRAMRTEERVSNLVHLCSTLHGSVPAAAARMISRFGPLESAGPYALLRGAAE